MRAVLRGRPFRWSKRASGARSRAVPLLRPMSDKRQFAVVILAAGQGTRMRSDTHKVLHPIAGRPMLLHLLAGGEPRAGAAGRGSRQRPRAGRGGLAARDGRSPFKRAAGHRPRRPAGGEAARRLRRDILILYADIPFVEPETMRRMLDRLDGDGRPGHRGPRVLAGRSAELRPHHPRPGRPDRQDGRI